MYPRGAGSETRRVIAQDNGRLPGAPVRAAVPCGAIETDRGAVPEQSLLPPPIAQLRVGGEHPNVSN